MRSVRHHRFFRVFIICIVAHSVLHATDLTSGRVERRIGRDARAQTSVITYMHYITRPDMPEYQRAINAFLSNSIGSLWQDQPEISTSALNREWYTDVLALFDSMYVATIDDNPEQAPWILIDSTFIEDRVVVDGRATDLVQMYRQRYQFTGGAHGLPTMLSMLFSRTTGKMLSFQEMLGTHRKAFTAIVERYFRLQQKIPARKSLKKAGYWFTKGFAISDNVQFSKDAITIVYNPYEIAPYSYGMIAVRVPINEVIQYISLPYAKQ